MASETLVDNEEGYKTAEEEVSGVVETPERDEEEESEKSGKKRRGRRKKATSTPTSTPVQRPSRERKAVQWYSVEASDIVSSPKGLIIQQGNGTPLKDIPNVVYKLSKRKTDENLQCLHRILFGKRTKTHNVKKNIQQFSGFIWVEDEEKQRAKLRERLDKFVKEQLLDFCDVLDIPVFTATKKDEILGKLLEFLKSPHATTEVFLADKEQSQKSNKLKRKKRASTGSASRGTSSKKRKQSAKAEKSEDEDEFESADTRHLSDEDGSLVTVRKEESNQEADESSGAEDTAKEVKVNKKSSGKSTKKGSEAKVKAEKGTHGIASEDKVTESHSKSKDSTSKNQKSSEKKSQKDQSAFSESKKTSSSGVQSPGEEGAVSVKGDVIEPSRDEMHAAVSEILKDMDFNTATLFDVIEKLGTVFGMKLLHMKLEVKNIIEEVMNNMPDDEDDDAGEADNDSEEDMKIADNGGEVAGGENDH